MAAPSSRPGETPRYWFATKRYGWGWGLPLTWEGWLVLVLYGLGLASAGILGDGRTLAIVVPVLTLLLIGVCALKGEPPRWRWVGRG